jgi:hypothetical protein
MAAQKGCSSNFTNLGAQTNEIVFANRCIILIENLAFTGEIASGASGAVSGGFCVSDVGIAANT